MLLPAWQRHRWHCCSQCLLLPLFLFLPYLRLPLQSENQQPLIVIGLAMHAWQLVT